MEIWRPLILQRPLKRYIVIQQVGEDRTGVDVATGTKIITRQDGQPFPAEYESLYKKNGLKGHDGVDLRIVSGEEVYAASDGIVWKSEGVDTNPIRGNNIEIVTGDPRLFKARDTYAQPAGAYYALTCYCHLKECLVKAGDRVEAGQLIGYADNTGASSGDHLHFELKAVNKVGEGYEKAIDNGYGGCTDPSDYIEGLDQDELLALYQRVSALEKWAERHANKLP